MECPEGVEGLKNQVANGFKRASMQCNSNPRKSEVVHSRCGVAGRRVQRVGDSVTFTRRPLPVEIGGKRWPAPAGEGCEVAPDGPGSRPADPEHVGPWSGRRPGGVALAGPRPGPVRAAGAPQRWRYRLAEMGAVWGPRGVRGVVTFSSSSSQYPFPPVTEGGRRERGRRKDSWRVRGK